MTVSVPAAGISFPATQVTSGTVNIQDDYEEGTWSITAQGNWGTNPSSQNAQYVKIGEQVFLQGYHVANIGSSGAVAMGTGSFPFTSSGDRSWSVQSVNVGGDNGNFYGFRCDNGTTKWNGYCPGGVSGVGWYHFGLITTVA